jgi:hypothetical protein
MGMSTEKLQGREKAFENRGTLEIDIEALVLHGFPDINRKQFQSVVEGELARLFDQQQPPVVWEKFNEISHVDAGRFEFRVDQGIESAGLNVARAMYRTLKGNNKRWAT